MESTLKIQGYGNLDVVVEKDVIDGLIDFYIWFDYVKVIKSLKIGKTIPKLRFWFSFIPPYLFG
ncbi:unnamed protein product, partial [marine sediment metagenome]